MFRFFTISTYLLITTVVSSRRCLILIGWLLKNLFPDRRVSIFLTYPANKEYARSYTFDWYTRRIKWHPSFGGVFLYGKNVGLTFFVGADEDSLSKVENQSRLVNLHKEMQGIAAILGAGTISYGGILPSIFSGAGVDREPVEALRTAHWVAEAIMQVSAQTYIEIDTPLVVLGASGFVGSKLIEELRARAYHKIVEIDSKHPDPYCRTAEGLLGLRGQRALLINIARNNVIEQYVDQLWEGLVILNEVYPECSRETLKILKNKNIDYFHIRGIKAFSWPAFPRAYAGAIPCCAASGLQSNGASSSLKAALMVREHQ